jgi:hypothetical protein
MGIEPRTTGGVQEACHSVFRQDDSDGDPFTLQHQLSRMMLNVGDIRATIFFESRGTHLYH